MANSVLATTLQLLRDQLIDNSFVSHPLFRAIEQNGGLVKVSGGARVEQSLIFGDHSSITQLSDGYDPVSLAVTDPFYTAKFEYANFVQPVILTAIEKLANKGDLAVVNILKSKMENVMLSLRREVNRTIIQGPAYSGSKLTDLQTFNGMTTAAGTGWFEGVAQASQQNVVGTLSKVTHQSQNWYNQFYDSGGAFDLSHLDQLFIDCQARNPAGSPPDIILMSPKCFGAFQAQQQSYVRYTSESDRGGLDKDMVGMWRGARIYMDPNLGFTAQSPAKAVSAYVLSSSNFKLYADQDGWFNVSDLMPVPGTAVEQASVLCRMQLVTGHLASHGVLLDAEA